MSTQLQIQLVDQILNGDSVVSGDRFEPATFKPPEFRRGQSAGE